MKKNSIFTKVLLAVVMVVLMISLVACGGKKTETKPPVEEKVSAVEQLVTIIKSVGPMVTTLNGIDDKTPYVCADAALGVNWTASKVKHSVNLGIAGNLGKTNPNAEIVLKVDDTTYFVLSYDDNTFYLSQPLNLVNNSTTAENTAMKVDISALASCETDLTYILMDVLSGINVNFDAAALGDQLNTLIGAMSDTIEEILVFSKSGDETTISIEGESLKTIAGLAGNFLSGTIGTVVDKACEMMLGSTDGLKGVQNLTGDDLPAIKIKVDGNETKGITKISLGYYFNNGDLGELVINLPTFKTSSTRAVTLHEDTSTYTKKNLNVALDAEVGQKGVSAKAVLGAMLDLSSKAVDMAQGKLTFTNNGASGDVVADFNTDRGIVFDMAGAFTALGKTEDAKYSANYKLVDEMVKATASWKADYIANKGASNVAASNAAGDAASVNATGGLNGMIYGILGGVPTAAMVDAGISELDVLKLLDAKFGDYVKFTIPTADDSSFVKLVDEVLKYVDYNKATNDQKIALKKVFTYNDKNAISGIKFATYGADNYAPSLTIYTADTEDSDLLDLVNLVLCDKDGTNWTAEKLANVWTPYVAVLAMNENSSNTDVVAYTNAVKELDATKLQAKCVFLEAKIVYENAQQTYSTAQAAYLASGKGKADKATFEAAKSAYLDALATYTAAKTAYDAAKTAHSTAFTTITGNKAICDMVIQNYFGFAEGYDLATVFSDGLVLTASTVPYAQKDTLTDWTNLNGKLVLSSKKGDVSKTYITIGGSVKLVAGAALNIATVTTDNAIELTYKGEFEMKQAKYADGTLKVYMADKTADASDAGYEVGAAIKAGDAVYAVYTEGTVTEANKDKYPNYAVGTDLAGKVVYGYAYPNTDAVIAQLWKLLEGYKAVVAK